MRIKLIIFNTIMKRVAGYYFSHYSIWIYILIAIILMVISYYYEYIFLYWYVLLFPIILAPIFEWVVHKYILHIQIGKVVVLEIQKGLKKGDKINILIEGKEKEVEVLKVNTDSMKVGYGWARKMKFIHDHMELLHYGHHKDPNNIPLIFAPLSSILILFAFLFLVSFTATFSLGVSTVFLLGSVIYYLYYEWIHLGHHIPGYKHFFSFNNSLKKSHQLHHFRNENYWWGITNSIGDKLFGTYKSYYEVEVSETLKNINAK